MEVALKFSSGAEGVLAGELQALKELAHNKHPHIVKFHGLLRHAWSGSEDLVSLGLVFEWCEFTLTSRCVNQFADLIELVAQVADALAFMHDKKYIHRDVKPMNVLVFKDERADWSTAIAKLADMGLTKKILNESEQQHTENQGTALFRAPEVERGSQYKEETDVFALGKSMEQLRLSNISSLFKTQSSQSSQSSRLTLWSNLEREATKKDYNERPKAAALRDQLRQLSQPAELQSEGGETRLGLVTGAAALAKAAEKEAGGAGASVVEEIVFVKESARLSDGDPKTKKWDKKYHYTNLCYAANVRTCVEAVERFGHKPCGKCAKKLW